MPSATIYISSTNIQVRLTGQTSSPTLTLIVWSSSTPKKGKWKKKKDSSQGTTITLDEVIELLDWDWKYLTLGRLSSCKDIPTRKKRKEEMRRE